MLPQNPPEKKNNQLPVAQLSYPAVPYRYLQTASATASAIRQTSPSRNWRLALDRLPLYATITVSSGHPNILLIFAMSDQQGQEKEEYPHHAIPRSPTQPDLGRSLSQSSARSRQPSPDRADLASITSHATNMPQYTSRDVGDPTQIKKNKQSMADLKLRRLTELNNRLREDLERERIPVSQASKR